MADLMKQIDKAITLVAKTVKGTRRLRLVQDSRFKEPRYTAEGDRASYGMHELKPRLWQVWHGRHGAGEIPHFEYSRTGAIRSIRRALARNVELGPYRSPKR